MPNKDLLPGFSKAMIKRLKAVGMTKSQLAYYANGVEESVLHEATFEAKLLKQNTIDLINEIWEQD